jgi:hypothetical protein
MPLNEEIVSALALANFKSIAELGAINALGPAKHLDLIAETALGKTLENLHSTDVPEGLGLSAARPLGRSAAAARAAQPPAAARSRGCLSVAPPPAPLPPLPPLLVPGSTHGSRKLRRSAPFTHSIARPFAVAGDPLG